MEMAELAAEPATSTVEEVDSADGEIPQQQIPT
jgi:hypothetical protein